MVPRAPVWTRRVLAIPRRWKKSRMGGRIARATATTRVGAAPADRTLRGLAISTFRSLATRGKGMTETTRVVARFLDGRMLNGTTQDFFPNRPTFHVLPMDGGSGLEVRCSQLKALFFVKSFEGDPPRKDLVGFVAGPLEPMQGK